MKKNSSYKKHVYVMLLAFILPIIICCSRQTAPSTGEVNYKSAQSKTITLAAVGYGPTKREAMSHAEKNAFEILLFRGVPGSPYPNPLINEPETEIKSEHKPFFKKFFDEQGYQSFITSTSSLTPGSKDKKTGLVKQAMELTINYHSLRTHLEQNDIIPKFGF